MPFTYPVTSKGHHWYVTTDVVRGAEGLALPLGLPHALSFDYDGRAKLAVVRCACGWYTTEPLAGRAPLTACRELAARTRHPSRRAAA